MNASRIRVLLVDDNADARLIMKRALEMAGFSAVTAANGAEVVMIQSIRAADILVANVSTLKMEGFETIESFRKAYPQTRIVAVVGDTGSAKDYRVAAALTGVDATVQRPVDAKELVRILRSLGTPSPGSTQGGRKTKM